MRRFLAAFSNACWFIGIIGFIILVPTQSIPLWWATIAVLLVGFMIEMITSTYYMLYGDAE